MQFTPHSIGHLSNYRCLEIIINNLPVLSWRIPISLVESKPKELFSGVPVLHVTAITKAQRKGLSGEYGPQGGFDCPVYKYALRTDKYIIFLATLAARIKPPSHWTLRGVALLCGSGGQDV